MGKKRIALKREGGASDKGSGQEVQAGPKKRYASGVLHIQSTYNNTKVLLANPKGDVLAWSSSGAIGFKGAKKGTPFAASKIGELMADKATQMGINEVAVTINGVGAGREAALRAFISKGINLMSISDITPVPHNGPRPPKPRRV